MTTFLLSIALGAGLLPALIHLLVVLIVLAIIYYIFDFLGRKLGAPEIVLTLWLVLCVLIALYVVVQFLLGIA
jgi:hypothetical protein